MASDTDGSGLFTSLLAQPSSATVSRSWNCCCAGCASPPADAQGAITPGSSATTPTDDAYRLASQVQAPLQDPDGGVAALIAGSKWTGLDSVSGKTIITYSFANPQTSAFSYSNSFQASLSEFSGADRQLTRDILAKIEAVANLQFVEVADNSTESGVLRYGYSQQPNAMNFAGYSFFPSAAAIGGDIWIGTAQASAKWDYYRPDLVLHETLHALGLKHPFGSGAVLTTNQNIIPNTVMSYSPVAGGSSGFLSQYPAEPMALDIAALQYLYGASALNAGNTLYDLAAAQFQTGFRAIWDAGGDNTFDASRIGQGVTLDLAQGGRSDVGVRVSASSPVGGALVNTTYTATVSIGTGTLIQNAVGSAYDDLLGGNSLDNVLNGGDGNDLLDGRGGDDKLLGGAGNDRFIVGFGRDSIDGGAAQDTAIFSGLRSDYAITDKPGQITVTRLSSPDNFATLVNVERVEFSDVVLASFIAGLSQTQAQAEVYVGEAFRLYQAAFDRLPDSEGLAFHAKSLQSGLALSVVARQFMASPEFIARYGDPQNGDFVDLLYQNVLNRSPDAEGLAYHMVRLESVGVSRADVLVAFSESPENQAAVVGLGSLPIFYPM